SGRHCYLERNRCASTASPRTISRSSSRAKKKRARPIYGIFWKRTASCFRRNCGLFAIICDGPVHQSGKRQVVYGARGDENVILTVYGPNRALHSGHYVNW